MSDAMILLVQTMTRFARKSKYRVFYTVDETDFWYAHVALADAYGKYEARIPMELILHVNVPHPTKSGKTINEVEPIEATQARLDAKISKSMADARKSRVGINQPKALRTSIETLAA